MSTGTRRCTSKRVDARDAAHHGITPWHHTMASHYGITRHAPPKLTPTQVHISHYVSLSLYPQGLHTTDHNKYIQTWQRVVTSIQFDFWFDLPSAQGPQTVRRIQERCSRRRQSSGPASVTAGVAGVAGFSWRVRALVGKPPTHTQHRLIPPHPHARSPHPTCGP